MASNEETKQASNAFIRKLANQIIKKSIQLLPTGTNVKMWASYGELAIKFEIVYVYFFLIK